MGNEPTESLKFILKQDSDGYIIELYKKYVNLYNDIDWVNYPINYYPFSKDDLKRLAEFILNYLENK